MRRAGAEAGGRIRSWLPRCGLSGRRTRWHAEMEADLFFVQIISSAVIDVDHIALVRDGQQAEATLPLAHAIDTLAVRAAFDGRILIEGRSAYYGKTHSAAG